MEILNLRATTSMLVEFDGKSEGQETRFDPVT